MSSSIRTVLLLSSIEPRLPRGTVPYCMPSAARLRYTMSASCGARLGAAPLLRVILPV